MKNYKKIIIILLALALLALVVSIVFGLSEKIGICSVNDWSCIDKFEVIAEPLFFISIPLIIVLCILFLRQKVFFVPGDGLRLFLV